MDIQKELINILKNVSYKEPMSITSILNTLTTVDDKIVIEALQRLYSERKLNWCIHTKNNITNEVWWTIGLIFEGPEHLSKGRSRWYE